MSTSNKLFSIIHSFYRARWDLYLAFSKMPSNPIIIQSHILLPYRPFPGMKLAAKMQVEDDNDGNDYDGDDDDE